MPWPPQAEAPSLFSWWPSACSSRYQGELSQGSLTALRSWLTAASQPSLQDMKAQRVPLWLLGAMLLQCSVHARGLRKCLISTDVHRAGESF